jgi:NADH-quinone oxidoreductase subunit E
MSAVKVTELTEILQKYQCARPDQLIPILQGVQAHFGFLSREAILEISSYCSLPINRVYGVATFYNQFRFHRPGRHHIQVCRGTACHVKGSLSVLDSIRRELHIDNEQTTADGEFSLEVVACVGACGLAPVMCIDGEFHGGVTPDKIRKLLNFYRNKGRTHAESR